MTDFVAIGAGAINGRAGNRCEKLFQGCDKIFQKPFNRFYFHFNKSSACAALL